MVDKAHRNRRNIPPKLYQLFTRLLFEHELAKTLEFFRKEFPAFPRSRPDAILQLAAAVLSGAEVVVLERFYEFLGCRKIFAHTAGQNGSGQEAHIQPVADSFENISLGTEFFADAGS